MGLLDSLIKYRTTGTCKKHIKYQSRTFEWKGFVAEAPNIKIDFKGMSTEVQNNIDLKLHDAIALDDFQFNYCNTLSNPMLSKNLSQEDLRQYTKILLGAQACMLSFRSALASYAKNPTGEADNLEKSVTLIREYIQSGILTSLTQDRPATDEEKKALSESFKSIDIDEKEVDERLTKDYRYDDKRQSNSNNNFGEGIWDFSTIFLMQSFPEADAIS